MSKRAVTMAVAAVLAALAALVLLVVSPKSSGQERRDALQEDRFVVIDWMNYTHYLSHADKERLGKIQSVIQTTHTITDADLAFALDKLKSEPVKREGDNKLVLQSMVLVNLIGRKNLTKPQAGKLIQAVTPLAYNRDSTVASYAAMVLGSVRDARVIPVLEDVLKKTKSSRVRDNAARNLPRLKELAASGAI